MRKGTLKMKKLMLAFLLMAVPTVHAGNVCHRCEIIDVAPEPGRNPVGTYVGSFWSNDRATFVNPTMVDFYGSHSYWSNYVVFDLNEIADVTITATPRRGTEFLGFTPSGAAFQIDLGADVGSICFEDNQCRVGGWGGSYGIAPTWDGTESVSIAVQALPPGRYQVVLQGYTNTTGENGYSGKIVVKRAR